MILSTIRTYLQQKKNILSIFYHESRERLEGNQHTGFLKIFGLKGSELHLPLLRRETRVKIKLTDELDQVSDCVSDIMDDIVKIQYTICHDQTLYPLKVAGHLLGEFTAAELHGLFGTLNPKLEYFYQTLPCRSTDLKWEETGEETVVKADVSTDINKLAGFNDDEAATMTLCPIHVRDIYEYGSGKDVQLLSASMLTSAFPQQYRDAIMQRYMEIRQSIVEILDSIQTQEVKPRATVGKKIMNYIHHGHPQGQEHYIF